MFDFDEALRAATDVAGWQDYRRNLFRTTYRVGLSRNRPTILSLIADLERFERLLAGGDDELKSQTAPANADLEVVKDLLRDTATQILVESDETTEVIATEGVKLRALTLLREGDRPLRPSDLNSKLRVDPGQLSRAIRSLLDDKSIEEVPRPEGEDGRGRWYRPASVEPVVIDKKEEAADQVDRATALFVFMSDHSVLWWDHDRVTSPSLRHALEGSLSKIPEDA